MADVQFVSELYLLAMAGVQDGNDDVLDEAYAEYDAEIPEEELCDARFQRAFDGLRSLPIHWRETRWKNQADLYSLWAALLAADDAGVQVDFTGAAQRLEELSRVLEGSSNEWTEPQRRYSDAVRQGSNKLANRQLRASLLQDLITGVTR